MALHPHRYLELIQGDAARIAAVAPGALARPVPGCPGWDVAEVVRHTGGVYNHKVAIMRLGRRPDEGQWQSTPPPGTDLVSWFDGSSRTLIDELAAHDPEDWAYTWWPPDETFHFWYRRMALESVVHRVDVEMAVGDLSTIDAALSSDGIDEVLTVFLGAHDPGSDGGPTGAVSIVSGGRTWIAHLDDEHTRVEKHGDATTAAEIAGEPEQVFLHLWGRAPLEDVGADGDAALLREVRRRLAAATQ